MIFDNYKFYAYFINENHLNPDDKEFTKAIIFFWCIAVLLFFLIPYSIYFKIYYPEDTVKNWTNAIGISLFALSFVWLKIFKNFQIPIIYCSLLSYIPIFISVYHTGGIFSADLAWVLVCMISQSLIVSYLWGFYSFIVVGAYLTYLFYQEKKLIGTENIFRQYVSSHDSNHFYYTWLFVSLLITVMIGTFAKVLKNTTKKLKDLDKEKISALETRVKEKTDEISKLRANIAKDFHDEMGNKLASITVLSQTIGMKIKNNETVETSEMLETIEKRSIELYQGTKDFIWSIDVKSDLVYELFIYLREFGEVFFNDLDIDFNSNEIDLKNSALKLPPNTCRQLIYIIKEIFTNAGVHSKCSEVDFNFEVNAKESMIKISIEDNGIGINLEKEFTRGIANMKQRAKKINADLKISSEIGKKSSFLIEISL